MTDLGFGVGRIDGIVIFIGDTVPGDLVEAKIIKANSSYLVGKVERLIKASELRVTGRCPEGACRSCAYRAISYDSEARLKWEGVSHLFDTAPLSTVVCRELIKSPSELRYRNKAQYPISMINGKYAVGFYAPKTHRVTPVKDCPLTPEIFADIVEELKLYFKENSIPVYDEGTGKGILRHIYLRRGEVSKEILLTIVVNSAELPNEAELVKRITDKFPDTVGILLNTNTKDTNVVLGERYRTLYGRDYIFDTLCGIRLKITAPSFYQVNHDCAEVLYEKARELAELKKADTLLDLFCGAGSIGLSMAKYVKEVIGIEIVESAVLCAKENADANGIENASFFLGDASDAEKLLLNAENLLGRKITPDVVILDPPRGGTTEKLIKYLSSLNPRKIVYISCNPKTLARDVILFKEYGYFTDSVTPVDMFPMTGHVESLVCLQKQTN